MKDDLLRAAVEAIRSSGVVAAATDTLVGLVARADDADAVTRVLKIKGPARRAPLPLLVDSIERARTVATIFPEAANLLAAEGWPGALTLIVPLRPGLFPPDVTAGGITIALRVPGPSPAFDLVCAFGQPLTGTSANRTGEAPPVDTSELDPAIRVAVDFVLPGCGVGRASRVVDVTGERPVILREG